LVRGSAIQIHPLVCTAFNADFDGDQMAVHVPLSRAAQDEARQLMMSSRNILSPADGSPIISPSKDMVLGCYYLTEMQEGMRGEGKVFADFEDAITALEHGAVDLHARVKLRITAAEFPIPAGEAPDPAVLETTAGRILLNNALPMGLRFVNERMDKGGLKRLIAAVFYNTGVDETVRVADQIKELGMRWATRSGVTMSIGDLVVPAVKRTVLTETNAKVASINTNFAEGLITEQERYGLTVQSWTDAMSRVSASVTEALDRRGPVYMMGESGAAKGNFDQIRQIAGMRGLMSDPSGRIIEMPVRSNFREGLSVLEYFISTHGARKGLADTALRTADSGYLTRRLVDVAQDVMVTEIDCGTPHGTVVRAAAPGEVADSVGSRCFGRVTLEPVVHPTTGEVLVEAGATIDRNLASAIDKGKVLQVHVRSVMQCRARRGICQMCYGLDLGRNELVALGTAVGIIAAQSIGEPATQLTMRTFHLGGIAAGTDIVQGLPRVEELFEARVPKGVALASDLNGTVEIHQDGDQLRIKVVSAHIREHEIPLGKDQVAVVASGDKVTRDQIVAVPRAQAEDPLQRKSRTKSKIVNKRLLAKVAGDGLVAVADGTVEVREGLILLRKEVEESVEYPTSSAAELRVQNGQFVSKGDQLTEGPLNPQDILRLRGRDAVQRYIVDEVQKVYRIVGVAVNDKHIEVIVRQMLRRISVDASGDTELLPGKLVDQFVFEAANRAMRTESKKPATGHWVLLGVTKASLNNESFLAAASFQDTTRVLTEAVVEGRVDHLYGLKENVIIGKLIPAGSGWQHYADKALADQQAAAGVLTEDGSAAMLNAPRGAELGLDVDEDEDEDEDEAEDGEEALSGGRLAAEIGVPNALDDVVATPESGSGP
ncbi:MAG: DNA-directed RNA polymerase subunit beta', partial [Actinobacteria bacterium]|nr:DNA-directed RNA polymerase subunit beta' [Actinomycetota bacterium]